MSAHLSEAEGELFAAMRPIFHATDAITNAAGELMAAVTKAIPDTLEPLLDARVAAAVAAEREARDKAWQALLNGLPDQMAEAWGRDAAWLTTGSKVADLVGDWLADLHYDLPEARP